MMNKSPSPIGNIKQQKKYKVIDLGHLGGGYSIAKDINNNNQVVGYSSTSNGEIHPFLWDNGKMIDIGKSKYGKESRALAINNSGQVIGYNKASTDECSSFFWKEGTTTDLGNLGSTCTIAQSINDKGQVVGMSRTSNNKFNAFLWDQGVITDLDTFGDDFIAAEAKSINNKGYIVGQSTSSNSSRRVAVLWTKDKMTDLNSLDGDINFAIATSINTRGQIVGFSSVSYSYKYGHRFHAFLWENGIIKDLGTLIEDNIGVSSAFYINEMGQIVGYSKNENGESHAFVFDEEQMHDLGKLDQCRGSIGNSINDNGDIVGYSSDKSGLKHATLWQVL